MIDELVFIVNYECPRCRVPLETRASGSMTWLRCPSCLRASVPPEYKRAEQVAAADDELFVIGPTTEPSSMPIRPRSMTPMPPTRSSRNQPARLMIVTGFLLCSILSFVSIVEGSYFPRAFLFGLFAVGLFGLLIRSTGSNALDERHD